MRAMPERDITTDEEAHDILAADAFAMPGVDPYLHHHGPVRLPDDPSDPGGRTEPHDILAAEEFPMPAPLAHPVAALAERRGGAGRLTLEVLGVLVLLARLRRRRRRHRAA
jgi:hypothetical protein